MLGEFAKYAFCGLKRKRRDFERSVLKHVSIKIPALTHSGRKSRVCVNAADRLLPPNKERTLPCISLNRKVLCILPCRRGVFALCEVWDACAACDFASPARGKGGLLGAAPLQDPLCTPPGTPPKRGFQLPESGEGTRLVLRELPSLATLAQVISLRDA